MSDQDREARQITKLIKMQAVDEHNQKLLKKQRADAGEEAKRALNHQKYQLGELIISIFGDNIDNEYLAGFLVRATEVRELAKQGVMSEGGTDYKKMYGNYKSKGKRYFDEKANEKKNKLWC